MEFTRTSNVAVCKLLFENGKTAVHLQQNAEISRFPLVKPYCLKIYIGLF